MESLVFLDPPVLADPQEDDPVDDQLDSGVEIINGKCGIAQRDVPGKLEAPVLDVLKELLVNTCRPVLFSSCCNVFVVRPFLDRVR